MVTTKKKAITFTQYRCTCCGEPATIKQQWKHYPRARYALYCEPCHYEVGLELGWSLNTEEWD